ncbi:hypothetical protein M4578_08820 [Salipiger sp. P9]|uniref:hypothetical protein n=1 Tax=Salipiger pentaromativorans TaxID=2943193 RepID=UPI0021586E6A|nr:hypothetical protein [Salipiger pentaromativorans]MCR8547929.1 hypothetical protein [Salipiger pentaromativorans]
MFGIRALGLLFGAVVLGWAFGVLDGSGAANDTIVTEHSDATVTGGDGDDVLDLRESGAGNDVIYTPALWNYGSPGGGIALGGDFAEVRFATALEAG